MAERPPIKATGRITRVHHADRLYEVTMSNGYRAYGIVERKGPKLEDGIDALECQVVAEFSPFDMSRCKIVEWQVPVTD